MKRLIVQQYDGTDVARIEQDAGGKLSLVVLVPALTAELQALLARLRSGSLPLRTGRRRETGQGPVYESLVRQVPPSDPEFLDALSDWLDRERIGGQRVLGRYPED